MKNNKEDSAALAKHARDITEKLFDALQSLDGLDSMKSNIDDFVKYVILLFLFSPCTHAIPAGFWKTLSCFRKNARRGEPFCESSRSRATPTISKSGIRNSGGHMSVSTYASRTF
jgi:hypothetical protein